MPRREEDKFNDNLKILAVGAGLCLVILGVNLVYYKAVRPWFTKHPTLSKSLTVAGEVGNIMAPARNS